MRRTDTIIIGGGQGGLAMSRCLSDRAIDHVVLERGRIAERWQSERWDSLKLLTPNWQSRLPGFRYQGDDPDGYMTMPQVVDFFKRYARSFDAPVEVSTSVRSVEATDGGYRVTTNQGVWTASNVVIATGYCDVPFVPAMGDALSKDIFQIVPTRYRNPAQLPEGGVLVVGASASGIQLADELHRAGRQVTLAVGRHTRLPRYYRGKDILWWFDQMGIVDETVDDVYDIEASRRQPSLQVIGRRERLDLGLLQERGVRLMGRALTADGTKMSFDDDLVATTTAAHVKLTRLLGQVDEFIERSGLASEVLEKEPIPMVMPDAPAETLDLRAMGIRSVLWGTGFKRHYPWLKVPILDERGELRHRGGVTPAPGLYALGLRFQRRRNSSFIDGVGKDAEALAQHIHARLEVNGRDRRVAC